MLLANEVHIPFFWSLIHILLSICNKEIELIFVNNVQKIGCVPRLFPLISREFSGVHIHTYVLCYIIKFFFPSSTHMWVEFGCVTCMHMSTEPRYKVTKIHVSIEIWKNVNEIYNWIFLMWMLFLWMHLKTVYIHGFIRIISSGREIARCRQVSHTVAHGGGLRGKHLLFIWCEKPLTFPNYQPLWWLNPPLIFYIYTCNSDVFKGQIIIIPGNINC